MPLIINKNLDIQGTTAEQKKPLDYRYGPWNSMAVALMRLHNLEEENDKTYYGLTIGIRVFDKEDPTKVIGVDEYWWQPRAVWNESTNQYEDGFIRKYPANIPTVEKDEDVGKVLGLSDGEHDYNAEWRDDNAEQQWGSLTPADSHSVVDSENP